MKAYKVEILILDFDNLGAEGIMDALQNTRYANDCINPKVRKITATDIGEWHDNHPLNNNETAYAEYLRLFS